ncbi:hypothetical protein K438DRAFT_1804051 [Mycena galopus ATCC 62051]|nr:hypothetical protein K438DRAFT_1804051 [Mycena galopus ATCC 62051]
MAKSSSSPLLVAGGAGGTMPRPCSDMVRQLESGDDKLLFSRFPLPETDSANRQ